MKKFLNFIAMLSLVVVFMAVPMLAAHAAPAAQPAAHIMYQETQPPADTSGVGALAATALTLGGVAAFVAALINFGKKFGVVKAGQADAYSTGLNLLLLVGIFAAQVTGNANLIPAVDAQAGSLATAATVVLAYVYQLWVSRTVHDNVLTGLPLIGTTLS